MPETDKQQSTSEGAKGVSFGSNTATQDKTTERSEIRKSRDDTNNPPNKTASYGYSRSLSFAPADVSSKFILVLADKIQIEDASFFETIIDELNMSIVLVCNERNKSESEKALESIASTLEVEEEWIELKWMKLPQASPKTSDKKTEDKTKSLSKTACSNLTCNECTACAKQQDDQLKKIKEFVKKFDCVAVLDDHLRWVQSRDDDDENDNNNNNNNKNKNGKSNETSNDIPPPSQLRDLACKLSLETGATDMTDSPFWKIF